MPTWFDDMEAGRVDRFGAYAVDRDEVIAFATAYDPQAFHLDDAAAAASPIFGRLAASGWHTAGMTMRMMVDHWKAIDYRAMGGAGLDEMVWLKPVYPGDVLHVETEVLEVRASSSRPQMGFLKTRIVTFNQHDEPVMRQVVNSMAERRPTTEN